MDRRAQVALGRRCTAAARAGLKVGSTIAAGPVHVPPSASGPATGPSVTLSSSTPSSTDLVLAFVGTRGTTDITFSSGFTSLAAINAANASGSIGKFTSSLSLFGLSATASSSVAGSGYYSVLVFLR